MSFSFQPPLPPLFLLSNHAPSFSNKHTKGKEYLLLQYRFKPDTVDYDAPAFYDIQPWGELLPPSLPPSLTHSPSPHKHTGKEYLLLRYRFKPGTVDYDAPASYDIQPSAKPLPPSLPSFFFLTTRPFPPNKHTKRQRIPPPPIRVQARHSRLQRPRLL